MATLDSTLAIFGEKEEEREGHASHGSPPIPKSEPDPCPGYLARPFVKKLLLWLFMPFLDE
jgi:hypothetical protein